MTVFRQREVQPLLPVRDQPPGGQEMHPGGGKVRPGPEPGDLPQRGAGAGHGAGRGEVHGDLGRRGLQY